MINQTKDMNYTEMEIGKPYWIKHHPSNGEWKRCLVLRITNDNYPFCEWHDGNGIVGKDYVIEPVGFQFPANILPQKTTRIPFKCPVCNGSGIVPPGFYISTSGFSTTNYSSDTCRACNGMGIIWSI